MKNVGTYKGFKLFEITNRDTVKGYCLGDIAIFLPDEELPELGYEDKVVETTPEAHEFVDSYKKTILTGTITPSADLATVIAEPDSITDQAVILHSITSQQQIYSDTLQEVYAVWDKCIADEPLFKGKNAGYEIDIPFPMDDKVSFVLAHSKTAPDSYVVWQCKTDPTTGKQDYFWGLYSDSHKDAIDNLCRRIVTYRQDNPQIIKEPQTPAQVAAKIPNLHDAVIVGLNELSSPQLEVLNRNFLLYLSQDDTNLDQEPPALISDFLTRSRVGSASVTNLVGNAEDLGKTDLLFNTKTGKIEHADAWVIDRLDFMAKRGGEFVLSRDGVGLPVEAHQLFDSDERARAEKIVEDAHKKSMGHILKEPAQSYSRAR